MPELTREEKLKLLEKLPPHLREIMNSEDTGAILLYLGKKYNLSDHQVSVLSKILGNVILGITPATNSSSEISAKVAVDTQTANNLVQDLNDLILSPKPFAPIPAPAPIVPPISATPKVIDLRQTPPPAMPIPVAPAPIPPMVSRFEPPRPSMPTPIIPPKPSPLVPLIEAEPHKAAPSYDTYRESVETPPTSSLPPQFIMRPPGLPPTDYPRDVLDLRKDRGEF